MTFGRGKDEIWGGEKIKFGEDKGLGFREGMRWNLEKTQDGTWGGRLYGIWGEERMKFGEDRGLDLGRIRMRFR